MSRRDEQRVFGLALAVDLGSYFHDRDDQTLHAHLTHTVWAIAPRPTYVDPPICRAADTDSLSRSIHQPPGTCLLQSLQGHSESHRTR